MRGFFLLNPAILFRPVLSPCPDNPGNLFFLSQNPPFPDYLMIPYTGKQGGPYGDSTVESHYTIRQRRRGQPGVLQKIRQDRDADMD